jgi:hypothetical protein
VDPPEPGRVHAPARRPPGGWLRRRGPGARAAVRAQEPGARPGVRPGLRPWDPRDPPRRVPLT